MSFTFCFQEEKEGQSALLTFVISQVSLTQNNQYAKCFGVTCSENPYRLILDFNQVNTHHQTMFSMHLRKKYVYFFLTYMAFLNIMAYYVS